jgi:hypothetical protein
MSQDLTQGRTSIQCLLSRLFKGRNDQRDGPQDRLHRLEIPEKRKHRGGGAQAEFALFNLNPRNGTYQEAYEGLEERLWRAWSAWAGPTTAPSSCARTSPSWTSTSASAQIAP